MRSLGSCMILTEMQHQFTRRPTSRSRLPVERLYERSLLEETAPPFTHRSSPRSRYSGAKVQPSSTIITPKGRKIEAQVKPFLYKQRECKWSNCPVLSAHQAAAIMSNPPNMAYLLSVAANAACINNNNTNHNYNNNNNNNNNNNINNNNNNNHNHNSNNNDNNSGNINNNQNSDDSSDSAVLAKPVTTSPVVSSTKQLGEVSRRRRKKDTDSPSSPEQSKKKSQKRDKRSAERNFPCSYCELSFGYKHVLLNHVRTHTGEKPFECTALNCGKRFTRDHHLKTHMRLHTGEKPYVCTYCDKRFVQVANLRRHMRVHTGERPYKCSVASCEAKFSDSNQLNAHRLTHSGDEAVPTSEERTDHERLGVQMANLKQRMGVLSIQRANKCDFVSSSAKFLDPTPLNAHRLIHSDNQVVPKSAEETNQKPSRLRPRPIYDQPYQFSSQRAVQDQPEDLSQAVQVSVNFIQEEPEDLSVRKSPRSAS